ncbi:hypothetical protein QP185_17240 [Sphingomonas aerolata]|uniref:hypothetical protein n=1 Tax=Sphingomonas aerolata TaxID=185951 RepID=UPI002FE14768
MTEFHRQSPIRHLPVAAALLVAVAAILGFVAMPGTMLEELVWRTGVAALIPAAQPPLGMTARVVLALATAVIGAAVTWSALFLLVGPGGCWCVRRVAATTACRSSAGPMRIPTRRHAGR